jgi:hypothetical protein
MFTFRITWLCWYREFLQQVTRNFLHWGYEKLTVTTLNSHQAPLSTPLSFSNRAVPHDFSNFRAHKYIFFDLASLISKTSLFELKKSLPFYFIVLTKFSIKPNLMYYGGKYTYSYVTRGWSMNFLHWNHYRISHCFLRVKIFPCSAVPFTVETKEFSFEESINRDHSFG